MAKKKDFKPDSQSTSLLKRLYLTPRQRRTLLKWTLYSLVLLVLSLLQDVILCRMDIFGATTDLVPCGIVLICLLEGAEGGSVFALIASTLYLFSGTAAGTYTIVIITLLSIGAAFFRQSYLRKGFGASMLCVALATVLYQLSVFFIAVFLDLTAFSRITAHLMSAAMTLVSAPILYPIVGGIYSIGGDAWKE